VWPSLVWFSFSISTPVLVVQQIPTFVNSKTINSKKRYYRIGQQDAKCVFKTFFVLIFCSEALFKSFVVKVIVCRRHIVVSFPTQSNDDNGQDLPFKTEYLSTSCPALDSASVLSIPHISTSLPSAGKQEQGNTLPSYSRAAGVFRPYEPVVLTSGASPVAVFLLWLTCLLLWTISSNSFPLLASTVFCPIFVSSRLGQLHNYSFIIRWIRAKWR